MPAGAKRKRNGKSGPPTKKVKEEVKDDQYYQGVSASEFGSWFGCGTNLLGSPVLTFQSPLKGPMFFELMSGESPSESPGTGGLRLCVPCEDPKDIVTSPTFMVPFQHVEQFLIIDEPSSKENGSSTGHGYRVIIVPTAAVGASALKRTYPKIISFMLPDSKFGSDFKGEIGEAADDPQETYRSLITRVFNEQLAPFNKSVIDASAAAAADEDSDARLVCDAVLKQSEDEGSKEDVKGQLFFLETGVLFHSQTTVLYLTSESTPNPMLVYNYEALAKRPGPANISLICRTTEPYYDKAQDGEQSNSKQNEEPLLISFHGIDADLSDGITRYAEKHGIKLKELEQEWYDLERGQPASGWMPRGFVSRTG